MVTGSTYVKTCVENTQKFVLQYHRPLVVSLNMLLTACSFVTALGLRFDFNLQDRLTFTYAFMPFVLLCAIRMGAYTYFRLNQGYWRYVSTSEAVDILKAHVLSSVIFMASVGFLRINSFPRSIVLIEFALSLLFSAGARLFVRLVCERYLSSHELTQDSKEVVVIGAGVSGHLLVKTLKGMPRRPYRPVAFFDDNESLFGASIHGVTVAGPISGLRDYLQRNTRVTAVLVAVPMLSSVKLKEIEDVCDLYHLPLKRLQSFEDIACQETFEPKSPISIEQVLSREVNFGHENSIAEVIRGKRVLITGAGGSIGSELVRQTLSFGPAEVVLLDQSEYNLFSIEQELKASGCTVRRLFRLATIVDKVRLERIFDESRPQIVFHAAAYKHVPLLESNSYEAFTNNILGTRNLIQVASQYGAERFIFISTDKAVDPTSLMGCTKRIAELMVSQADSLARHCPGEMNDLSIKRKPMSTAVVRFGNVINSAGSVIPMFKKQILAGGPLTVTHPKMERYFMSISEAVRLVLTAGTLGAQGEIFLLDMGKPIRIVDVAEKLLALYGRRDIPIVFTGLRPGEKLTERLFSHSEARSKTRFKKIFALRSLVPCADDVFAWVREIEDQLFQLTDLQIEAATRGFVVKTQSVDRVDQRIPALEVPVMEHADYTKAAPRIVNA